nr:hypothetical protein [Candidatus Bathyarchaeota archaeon]
MSTLRGFSGGFSRPVKGVLTDELANYRVAPASKHVRRSVNSVMVEGRFSSSPNIPPSIHGIRTRWC